MKHILRPYHSVGSVLLLGISMTMAPPGAYSQGSGVVELVQEGSPLLLHSASSQGYLGVDVSDVDQDKAQTLKLKEVRGAVITLIDHDAPAGQINLKVNDVVLQLNGQNVEGAEQLRRMLREIPAGHKVSIEISRDGNIQTLGVELADRRIMERDVWTKLGKGGDVFAQPAPGLGILNGGGGDAQLPGVFGMPIWGSTLNVGALVEPLTSQMADYLGVTNGLMVKQVARKSEAAAAGLMAHDVILKVGQDAITTLSGWDRALRANEGKQVQITILRERKQQTLSLQVDSKHKTGELLQKQFFADGDCPLVAEVDPDMAQIFGPDGQAAKSLRDQAQALAQQMKAGHLEQFQMSPKQAEELRGQAEKMRDELKANSFQFDRKQLDELKQQMEEFRKDFKPEDFKVDPKKMQEMKQELEDLKGLPTGDLN
jgi:hypothetical protein